MGWRGCDIRTPLTAHCDRRLVVAALACSGPALDRVELGIMIAPDLPLVSFDAVLIEPVRCNLPNNALKYARNSKSIKIVAAENHGDIEVSDEDRGPGIFDSGADGYLTKPFGNLALMVRSHLRKRQDGADGAPSMICLGAVSVAQISHTGEPKTQRAR